MSAADTCRKVRSGQLRESSLTRGELLELVEAAERAENVDPFARYWKQRAAEEVEFADGYLDALLAERSQLALAMHYGAALCSTQSALTAAERRVVEAALAEHRDLRPNGESACALEDACDALLAVTAPIRDGLLDSNKRAAAKVMAHEPCACLVCRAVSL